MTYEGRKNLTFKSLIYLTPFFLFFLRVCYCVSLNTKLTRVGVRQPERRYLRAELQHGADVLGYGGADATTARPEHRLLHIYADRRQSQTSVCFL